MYSIPCSNQMINFVLVSIFILCIWKWPLSRGLWVHHKTVVWNSFTYITTCYRVVPRLWPDQTLLWTGLGLGPCRYLFNAPYIGYLLQRPYPTCCVQIIGGFGSGIGYILISPKGLINITKSKEITKEKQQTRSNTLNSK